MIQDERMKSVTAPRCSQVQTRSNLSPAGRGGGHEVPPLIYLQLIPAGKGKVSCLQRSVSEHISLTKEQAAEVAGQHKTDSIFCYLCVV